MDASSLMAKVYELLTVYGIKVVAAIAIFIIGCWVARAWTSADNYWGFYCDTTEKVKKQFDAEGINIPYPQWDVHVYDNKV